MSCSIIGCENKVRSRGWCKKHYTRWLKYSDPLFTKYPGYKKHSLYGVWQNMKTRCYNPNSEKYKDYGNRGIIVCDEWKNSAKTFIEWALENGWKEGLYLDRIDNDSNYEPSNCRFVTMEKSNINKRLLQSNNTSGYRGASWHKSTKKWQSRIMINGKEHHLGIFDSQRLAAIRHDVEAYLLNDGRPRNIL